MYILVKLAINPPKLLANLARKFLAVFKVFISIAYAKNTAVDIIVYGLDNRLGKGVKR